MEKHIQWALDNIPALATYERDAIEGLVKRAKENTAAVRIIFPVAFGLAAAYLGQFLHQDIFDGVDYSPEPLWIIAITSALGVFLGTLAADATLHMRIRKLARGT